MVKEGHDTMVTKECLLIAEQLPLLQAASPATRDILLCEGQIRYYPRNEVLQRSREAIQHIYIQLEGKSIVYNLTREGRRKILFIFGGGMLLNNTIQDDLPASVYYETIEKSCLLVIPVTTFRKCMAMDVHFMQAVLRVQELKMRRLSHQLKNTIGSIRMERKLASKLWKLARDFGIPRENGIEIDINLPISFLADLLGAPRETTSRLCQSLIKKELIQMNRKRIVVLDAERLSHFYRLGVCEIREASAQEKI